MFSKQLAYVLGIIIAGTVIVSCTPTQDSPPNPTPGIKASEQSNTDIALIPWEDTESTIKGTSIDPLDDSSQVSLLDENTLLLYMSGSSSCKPTPLKAEAVKDKLVITLKKFEGNCTADLAHFLWKIDLPDTMKPSKQTPDVELQYPGTILFPKNVIGKISG